MSNCWTQLEDEELTASVKFEINKTNQEKLFSSTKLLVFGYSWEEVAKRMTTKSSRECRERFLRTISPETHNPLWSTTDRDFLSLLCHEYNKDMDKILDHFPCKLPEDVLNAIQKRSLKRKTVDSQGDIDDDVIEREQKYCKIFKEQFVEKSLPGQDGATFEQKISLSCDVTLEEDFEKYFDDLILCV